MRYLWKKLSLSLCMVLWTAQILACTPPIPEYDYIVKDNQVIYTNYPNESSQQTIEGVDIASFSKINRLYAKDQYNVFYQQNKLKDADPATFALINGAYTKDHSHVYYNGVLVPDLDPATFDFLDGAYTKDRSHVYYHGVLVPDLDPATFSFISSSGYVKDKQGIFNNGKKLPWLDVNSFKIISSQYVQDKNGIYYHALNPATSDVIDVKTGVILEKDYYSKDSKYVYFAGKKIPLANPDSFQPMHEDFLAKDSKHVFLYNTIIEDADPLTFKVLGSGYAKDKHHVYFRKNDYSQNTTFSQIPELDAATFELFDEAGYAKDKSHVYFLDKDNANYFGNNSRKLTDLDSSTFEVFAGTAYAKDKTHVYFYKKKIEEADASSFRALNHTFAKDASHVYQSINNSSVVKLDGFDAETFELVLSDDPDRYFPKDKNGIYKWFSFEGILKTNMKMDAVDSQTFSFLKGGKYSIDKKHVYYYSHIVNNADPQSFEVLEHDLAKDKGYVYRSGEATRLDPATFQILGLDNKNINVKDKNGVSTLPVTLIEIPRSNCGY